MHHSAQPPARSSAASRMTDMVPTVIPAPFSSSPIIAVRKKGMYSALAILPKIDDS